ncbi:hypothetical protein GCM10007967_24110 [Xylanimonas ulmi]
MTNDRLRAAIASTGLTVDEFARLIGAAPQAVVLWISANVTPSPGNRGAAARLLGVGAEELWPNAESGAAPRPQGTARRGEAPSPSPYWPRAVGRAAETLAAGWILTLAGLVLGTIAAVAAVDSWGPSDRDSTALFILSGLCMIAGAVCLLVTSHRFIAQRDEEYLMAVDQFKRERTPSTD